MNLSEVLALALEAGESGRAGGMVEIIRSLKIAVDAGKKDDFFSLVNMTHEEMIAYSQKHAFEKENLLKQKTTDDKGNNAA